MTLTVIIATLNRSHLLRAALDSLCAAHVPPNLEVTVNVVDNGSHDDTRAVVEQRAKSQSHVSIRYLFEPRPGQAFALNTGIASANADLLGMLDDDETVDPNWYRVIAREFNDSGVQFIGGPYLPNWAAPAPTWLPRQKNWIIGWIELSPIAKNYGPDGPGILCGGNAVIRRALLERAGPFRTDVGGHHDADMFYRFLAMGASGRYIPDLIIHHHIPAERLRRRYFRRWMWNAGLAHARMRQKARRTLAGVPLYVVRMLGQAMLRTARELGHPNRRFEAELELIRMMAYTYECIRYRQADGQYPT
jgi:glucosyl-dolichyl phosphate glucuronosyltransferase